jgi:hypothetical protein
MNFIFPYLTLCAPLNTVVALTNRRTMRFVEYVVQMKE